MMPKVFMTKSFLVWLMYFREIPRNKLPESKRDWKAFLEKFVFEDAIIYMDIDETIIERSEAIINGIEKEQTEDEKILAFGIYELTRKNLIRFCKKEIEIFSNNQFQLYDQMKDKPDFLFLSNFYTDEMCKEIADGFGIFCVNNNLIKDGKATTAQFINVEQNQQFRLYNKFPYLPPINSVIILDQYIFANDVNGNFLIELINDLKPNNLQIRFDLSILSLEHKNRVIIVERIKRLFANINISWLELGRYDDSHDRHIFTNNFLLTSGWGFKRTYQNGATRIDYSPHGVYHQRNIETLKLKTQKLNLSNRLCNG